MVLVVGGGREAFEVELLGFESVGWGGGFDFGDKVGDFWGVHFVFSNNVIHGVPTCSQLTLILYANRYNQVLFVLTNFNV